MQHKLAISQQVVYMHFNRITTLVQNLHQLGQDRKSSCPNLLKCEKYNKKLKATKSPHKSHRSLVIYSMYCSTSSPWRQFGRNTRSAIQGTSSSMLMPIPLSGDSSGISLECVPLHSFRLPNLQHIYHSNAKKFLTQYSNFKILLCGFIMAIRRRFSG